MPLIFAARFARRVFRNACGACCTPTTMPLVLSVPPLCCAGIGRGQCGGRREWPRWILPTEPLNHRRHAPGPERAVSVPRLLWGERGNAAKQERRSSRRDGLRCEQQRRHRQGVPGGPRILSPLTALSSQANYIRTSHSLAVFRGEKAVGGDPCFRTRALSVIRTEKGSQAQGVMVRGANHCQS